MTIQRFDATDQPRVQRVGGKAASLGRMTCAGLPVPPGFTCTVEFFEPWIDHLRSIPEWTRLQAAIKSGDELRETTEALKNTCGELRLTSDQESELAEALAPFSDDAIFAVRSSSPEEDLAGASFAGGYESVLGVTRTNVEDALRRAFASAFDERVFVYKAQRGFSGLQTRIAVVVQELVRATSAGVAFSLNPVNNDYDEVVINANHGLGESVVSGLVAPDHFVIDKPSGRVIERQLGDKARVVVITEEGKTEERPNPDASSFCVDDQKLQRIAELVTTVERVYRLPVDVEWAFSGDKLYLLQARPITTHVPLPRSMLTAPDAPRRLYFDFGLVDMMTINQPIKPLTMDWLFGSLGMWITPSVGPTPLRADGAPAESLVFGAGGRPYLNFSQLLTLVDVRRFAGSGSGTSQMDELTARLLGAVDVERYRAPEKLPALRWPRLIWRALQGLPYMLLFSLRMLHAMWRPKSVYRAFRKVIEETVRRLSAHAPRDLTIRELIERLNEDLTGVIGKTAAPPMTVYINYMMTYMGRVERLVASADAEDQELARALSRGFAGNEATRIGIQLYHLAKMLNRADFDDHDALARRIDARAMPQAFLEAWDTFLNEFGARGPNELELSNPRYGDDPRVAIEQMSNMVETDFNPEQTQSRQVADRRRAYEALLEKSSGPERRKLRRVYRILDLYGPARDTPKHLWVLDNNLVRRQCLAEGEKFVNAGRLDSADDIFWLTLNEIDAAKADDTLDMRALRDAQADFYEQLNRVRTFPHLIDSRGRIVRIEHQGAEPNVLVGQGISSGRATGRVKVLHSPREKIVQKGDILVTYTTDPGWTPLFVNAEAVVLEIGGMLQHGGVVAREYAKPCVVGIQGITETLVDGQLIEVDGTAGTVRLLEARR